jgi:hypothetical protein
VEVEVPPAFWKDAKVGRLIAADYPYVG